MEPKDVRSRARSVVLKESYLDTYVESSGYRTNVPTRRRLNGGEINVRPFADPLIADNGAGPSTAVAGGERKSGLREQ
jgi:hypothetical protein